METPKYAVIKWDEWTEYQRDLNHTVAQAGFELPDVRVLEGAEVIRHQDITAAPIFYHYASAMRSLSELGKLQSVDMDHSRLSEIADHFFQAAVIAEEHPHKKLPD